MFEFIRLYILDSSENGYMDKEDLDSGVEG